MYKAKRICAAAAAFALSLGVFSGFAEDDPAVSGEPEPVVTGEGTTDELPSLDDAIKEIEENVKEIEAPAETEEEEGDGYIAPDNGNAQGVVETEKPGSPDDDGLKTFVITPYAQKLKELTDKQSEIDSKLRNADDRLEENEQAKKLYLESIAIINEKIEVLNSYMTGLEISMNNNRLKMEEKQREIDVSIEAFKKRLRALYLSGGDESYINVLLSSTDFFDILMRVELVKRVAKHDDGFIDSLNAAKAELEKEKTDLANKQKEYDHQMETLNGLKAYVDEMLARNEDVRKEYESEKKKLEEQRLTTEQEKENYDQQFGAEYQADYGDHEKDIIRRKTELAANSALDLLHKLINDRKQAGIALGEYEPEYVFRWPVPGLYFVSSGVGARWGSYHTGIDIPGSKGVDIRASESGTVKRVNTDCPHNYGKNESCGCGYGYGNFVEIDHGNGFSTLYGHMTSVDVKPGQQIKQGQHIGTMGTTGYSTGEHLHFEIRYNGMIVNPAKYVVLDR